ncbi:MAG TPA: GNAT family protein [Gaiellales bacterium]|nr:GNAT family protein [Gaiellales bacterium]
MPDPLSPPSEPPSDGTVVLRLRRAGDVAAIAEASHDPETLRWLEDEPTAPGPAESVARAAAHWRSGRRAPFVIADAATDAPLGLVNVQVADDPEIASLAVSVFPQARGRGVAPRALRLAAAWALGGPGLQRVVAEAAVDNTASIRAIEKAGFHREGVLRSHCRTHGRRHDCVMFSLVPEDLPDLQS